MSAQLAQALELGLDAAKTVLTERKASFAGYPHKWSHEQEAYDMIAEAIVALAAHEAAPQQEPAIIVTIDDLDLVQDWAESRLPPGTHKLYAAPQQAQAPTSEDIESQDWAGMYGTTAYHLIERHAEDWGHAGRLMEAWRLAQQAQAPDGWRLVPVDPTPEMRKAAADAWLDCDSRMLLNKAAAAVRAGIKAAPQQGSNT